MTISPLDHSVGFWKPVIDPEELRSLASYRDPSDPRLRGINVWKADSDACQYRIVEGGSQYSLFAAVHPIEDVPPSSEVLAEIRDRSGNHHSYVLWFPGEESVVVPFDTNAAVEAFWHEKYVPLAKRTVLPQAVLSLYYALKPILPRGAKASARRLMARRAGTSGHFLEWPADDSLDLLQRLLLRLVLTAMGRQHVQFAWFWPDQRFWAVVLTHDVETAEGLANVSRVAGMERERDLRSSFNLVPYDYEIPGPLLRQLLDDGFEIGVHGYKHDGLLFSRWSTFLERIVTINECGRQWGAAGFRSPATYRNQDWFHLLGFEYDSSVSDTAPFEPQPGGCASFFPFAADHLIELPITVPQDHTLFGVLGQSDAETWLTKLRRIMDANGMACVLTHPDPAAGYIGMPENEGHYAELLDAVADSGAWTPLPRDLARWWRTRALTPSSELGNMEGVSYGSIVLDSSGRIEIVPPAG